VGNLGIARELPEIFLATAITSERGKSADFKFGRYIHRVHPNKSLLKILEKRECTRIQGLPIVGYPIMSGTVKAMNFKFCTHIRRVDRNKSP